MKVKYRYLVRRRLFLIIISLLGISIYAVAEILKDVAKKDRLNLDEKCFSIGANYEYNPIVENQITIVASYPMPSGKLPTVEAFNEIKECGFNLISCAVSSAYVNRVIEVAKESGISLLIRSGVLLTNRGGDFVNKYRDCPIILGWYVKDEPQFSELDSILYYYDVIMKSCPEKLTYINLIGSRVEKFTGPNFSYGQYLELIQKKFKPAVWCYDFYPISEENNKIKVAYNNFYSDLELYARISSLTKRPFWAYCQCMEFKNKKVYRPAPTVPFLRFEAFSALAYGAQGIVYWAYAQQKSLKEDSFLSAPIDMNGKKTKAWYAVQRVNQEIKAYSEVFLNSEVIDCQHTGNLDLKNVKRYQGNFGPIKTIKTEEKGVLLAHLKNTGGEYLVIVNHDVNSLQCIELELSLGLRGEQLLFGDDKETITSNGKLYSSWRLSLSPGGYSVIKLIF